MKRISAPSPHPLDPLDVPAPHNHPQMADSSPVQRRQYSLRVQQHVELGSDDFAMECDAESSDIFSSAPNTPVKRPLFGPSIPFEQLDPVFLADGEEPQELVFASQGYLVSRDGRRAASEELHSHYGAVLSSRENQVMDSREPQKSP